MALSPQWWVQRPPPVTSGPPRARPWEPGSRGGSGRGARAHEEVTLGTELAPAVAGLRAGTEATPRGGGHPAGGEGVCRQFRGGRR